jgi:hypothetical protein
MMRSPNSEVSGQSLKAQDDLQDGLQDSLMVPKKAENTVRSNGAAGNTVQKKPQKAKFIKRRRAGSQAVCSKSARSKTVLQEADNREADNPEADNLEAYIPEAYIPEAKAQDTARRVVKNRSAGTDKADVALIKDKKRHSDLAMRAAKRIKGSKNKRKTSHLVCHHLRMMLSSPEAQPRTTYYYPPAYMRRAVAVNERVGQYFLPI